MKRVTSYLGCLLFVLGLTTMSLLTMQAAEAKPARRGRANTTIVQPRRVQRRRVRRNIVRPNVIRRRAIRRNNIRRNTIRRNNIRPNTIRQNSVKRQVIRRNSIQRGIRKVNPNRVRRRAVIKHPVRKQLRRRVRKPIRKAIRRAPLRHRIHRIRPRHRIYPHRSTIIVPSYPYRDRDYYRDPYRDYFWGSLAIGLVRDVIRTQRRETPTVIYQFTPDGTYQPLPSSAVETYAQAILDHHGLRASRCSSDSVVLLLPNEQVVCAYPNSEVTEGFYEVHPETWKLKEVYS